VHFYSLSLYTYPYIIFIFIMYKLDSLASLAKDRFEEPISGDKGLDSSHFLGYGPSVAQIHVG
jgi:hypothetical protein